MVVNQAACKRVWLPRCVLSILLSGYEAVTGIQRQGPSPGSVACGLAMSVRHVLLLTENSQSHNLSGPNMITEPKFTTILELSSVMYRYWRLLNRLFSGFNSSRK